MIIDEVQFLQDDGFRLDGDLYRSSANDPSALIVFCHGYNATRGLGAPQIAQALASRLDVAVLAFDYSGFGTSEGPRSRLDPQREVRDVQAAISFIARTFPLAQRVGLYGASFGGAVAMVCAAVDDRVRAAIGVNFPADGRRHMRDLRPYWQWLEFQNRLAEDRAHRVLLGSESAKVSPTWILPRDPTSEAFNEQSMRDFPERRTELDLVSAELITNFSAISYADRLQDKRTLVVSCVRDAMVPFDHGVDFAAAARADHLAIADVGHYEIHEGRFLDHVSDAAADWYRRNLLEGAAG